MFVFPQFLLAFLLSILIIISVNGTDPTEFAEDTLSDKHGSILYSSSFSRHGDRSPTVQYPTDPYNQEYIWQSLWPHGKGELTETGRVQEFNLGKWFHKRYHFLLTTRDRNKLVKMDSSNVPRTIMSAKFFLHGFFRSEYKMPADEELNGVKLVEIGINDIISFLVNCKKYKSEKEATKTCPELKKVYLNYENTFDFIGKESGLQVSSDNLYLAFKNVFELYTTLFIEQLYGLTLPPWTNSVYPDLLKSIGIRHLSINVYTEIMLKLRAGPLIGEVVKEMESKIQGNLDTVLHFHSSHETTIAGLLVALGLFDNNVPPYAASLIFELREKGNEHFVTILYRTETTSAPRLLELENCKPLCTFKKFKSLVKKLIPEDWNKECENDLQNYAGSSSSIPN